MDNEILFTESQKFKQWWLWVLLIGINGILIFVLYQQIICGKQFGDKPMSDTGFLRVFGLISSLTLLFLFFRLETIIKKDGIYVRFFPIHIAFRKYTWEKIDKAFVRKYNPITEYGGWGLRYGLFGKGKALNVSGNKGLQLVFHDNSQLLIGTNKPEELAQALKIIEELKMKGIMANK